jgi:murein DD-endopeptidase MepM/ murein hydrolase activator NlpD
MAVADGVVVGSLDSLENQVPGELPDPSMINLENIDANYVVIDHGDGFYSFYAHFQPGSVRYRSETKFKRAPS